MHQRTRVGALHSQDSKDHIRRVLTLGDMMCAAIIYASQKRHEHDHACALGPCRKRYTTNLPSNHIFRRNDERNHRRAVAASVFVAFSSHAIVSADKKHMPALWADSRECKTTGEGYTTRHKDHSRTHDTITISAVVKRIARGQHSASRCAPSSASASRGQQAHTHLQMCCGHSQCDAVAPEPPALVRPNTHHPGASCPLHVWRQVRPRRKLTREPHPGS